MQVMLSVPVPSDIVISPFAKAYYIISSIINEVSPFNFFVLVPGAPTDFVLANFKSGDVPTLPFFDMSSPFCDLPSFVGDI